MYKDLSPTFNYFGYIPRGGIPESYRMMFNILRNDIKFYDIFYVAQYFILFFLIIFWPSILKKLPFQHAVHIKIINEGFFKSFFFMLSLHNPVCRV